MIIWKLLCLFFLLSLFCPSPPLFFFVLLASNYSSSSSSSYFLHLHIDIPRICLPGSFMIIPLGVALHFCFFLFLFLGLVGWVRVYFVFECLSLFLVLFLRMFFFFFIFFIVVCFYWGFPSLVSFVSFFCFFDLEAK